MVWSSKTKNSIPFFDRLHGFSQFLALAQRLPNGTIRTARQKCDLMFASVRTGISTPAAMRESVASFQGLGSVFLSIYAGSLKLGWHGWGPLFLSVQPNLRRSFALSARESTDTARPSTLVFRETLADQLGLPVNQSSTCCVEGGM